MAWARSAFAARIYKKYGAAAMPSSASWLATLAASASPILQVAARAALPALGIGVAVKVDDGTKAFVDKAYDAEDFVNELR